MAGLPDEDFDKPSGCTGWLVRDLVCHLVIDAQDVLITLVTPADEPATTDAPGYRPPRPGRGPGRSTPPQTADLGDLAARLLHILG